MNKTSKRDRQKNPNTYKLSTTNLHYPMMTYFYSG